MDPTLLVFIVIIFVFVTAGEGVNVGPDGVDGCVQGQAVF